MRGAILDAGIAAALTRIFDAASKPKVSSSLRALFTAKNFNLEQLMKEGETESQKKYIAPRMREILESDKDEEMGGVSADDMNGVFTATIPVSSNSEVL